MSEFLMVEASSTCIDVHTFSIADYQVFIYLKAVSMEPHSDSHEQL